MKKNKFYQARIKAKRLQEFVDFCENTLVHAARDLAILTKHGIRATEIVKLATLNELLEKLINDIKKPGKAYTKINSLIHELSTGMISMCKTASQISVPSFSTIKYHKSLNYFLVHLQKTPII